MGKIYFIRHAKPDISIHDDLTRPLTSEGVEDSKKVMEFLVDKNITKVYSSPYKRAVDTIKTFADEVNLEIRVMEELRERKVGNEWIEDFYNFSKKQWEDFEYKLQDGESLREVQERNINALRRILEESSEDNIVIGTHGTALCTIMNHYNSDFGYSEFDRIKHIMPWIVCAEIKDNGIISLEEFIL